MITGDHAGTATAVAQEMGIDDGNGAVTGAQLEEASDTELAELARTRSVFARTSPEHKLRLVRALQDRSEEHTSELQSRGQLVCRLLLEKNNTLSVKWLLST